MADHGPKKNGINWIGRHIDYRKLHTVLNEVMAGFAHIYAYGVSKCTFLAELTGRPIHNLGDINCLPPDCFNHERRCNMTCHKFPKFALAAKTAHFFYDLLMLYLLE